MPHGRRRVAAGWAGPWPHPSLWSAGLAQRRRADAIEFELCTSPVGTGGVVCRVDPPPAPSRMPRTAEGPNRDVRVVAHA